MSWIKIINHNYEVLITTWTQRILPGHT